MTRISKTILHCGKCNNEISIDFYDSVNVTVDPELKEKVLKEEINSGACSKCGAINQIVVPFLYHDMDLKLMVWVYPKEDKIKANEIKERILEQFQETKRKLPRILTEGHIETVVFGIEELKEKLKELGDLLRSELKLYAEEKGEMKLIAAIYVKNHELVVEAEDFKAKEDLLREINSLIQDGGIFIFDHIFKNDDYILQGTLINTQHPYFLYALKNCSYLWQSNKKYGKHIIYGFSSMFFEEETEEKNVNQIQSIILGTVLKEPATQKFNIKVYAHPHKNEEYSKHILSRIIKSGPIHIFYRSMTAEEKTGWNELYFNAANMNKKFINDYARQNPKNDFFECCLTNDLDEQALKECDGRKFKFLEELMKKYKDISKQYEKEKEIIFLERMLKLKLPRTYKEFLIEFGSGYKMKMPIAGVPNIYGLPADSDYTSVLGATFVLRHIRKDISPDFVVIRFFYDYALCLDLREKPADDAPLVKIDLKRKGSPVTNLHQSFSEYLKKYKDKNIPPAKNTSPAS